MNRTCSHSADNTRALNNNNPVERSSNAQHNTTEQVRHTTAEQQEEEQSGIVDSVVSDGARRYRGGLGLNKAVQMSEAQQLTSWWSRAHRVRLCCNQYSAAVEVFDDSEADAAAEMIKVTQSEVML